MAVKIIMLIIIMPNGWDHWQGMTNLLYFGPHVSVVGKLIDTPNSTYQSNQTDYIRDRAVELILTKKRNKISHSLCIRCHTLLMHRQHQHHDMQHFQQHDSS